MSKKIIIYVLLLTFISSILLVLPEARPASAHINRTFGDYVLEVGWDNEPVYASMKNSVFISVNKGSGDNAKPVINALKNMETSIKYGTVSKQLDFLPSTKEDGAYISSIIPTRIGTYSLVLKGTIDAQKIDTEISLDDVSSINELNFPQANSLEKDDTKLDGKIIDNLASNIVKVQKKSDESLRMLSNSTKYFQDFKYSLDMLYMINMTVIGVGISAIVISVYALKISKNPDMK